MSHLFSPLTLRGVTLRNRTVLSPMVQFSARHGFANDWHLVHLGRFALGGFGLVILEATGVLPEGRYSYADLGLWEDAQIAPLARIVDFLRGQGAAACIQIGHAGNKASSAVPWRKEPPSSAIERDAIGYEDWLPVAPSAVPRDGASSSAKLPAPLDRAGLERVYNGFTVAADRADRAGFDALEIYAGHGFLLDQFLSPSFNRRGDEYGGTRENRMRFPLAVIEAVRAVWPAQKPLLVRISASDGQPGGWAIEDAFVFAAELKARGVDLIDCSSGGFEGAPIKAGPAAEAPYAQIRRNAEVPTMAVGFAGAPAEAEALLENGEADLIAFVSSAIEDPNWPLHARHALSSDSDPYALWPKQAGTQIRTKDLTLHLREFATT